MRKSIPRPAPERMGGSAPCPCGYGNGRRTTPTPKLCGSYRSSSSSSSYPHPRRHHTGAGRWHELCATVVTKFCIARFDVLLVYGYAGPFRDIIHPGSFGLRLRLCLSTIPSITDFSVAISLPVLLYNNVWLYVENISIFFFSVKNQSFRPTPG